MSEATSEHQWYLARDGKQTGPMTDREIEMIADGGHLRPTDLVWRAGFADWRPATAVFPSNPAPRPAPPEPPKESPAASVRPQARPMGPVATGAPRPRMPEGGPVAAAPRSPPPSPAKVAKPIRKPKPPRGRLRRWPLFAAVLLLLLGGGGWFGLQHRQQLEEAVNLALAWAVPAADNIRASPFETRGESAEAVDDTFQKTALWRLIKQEFPDWYAERITEAAKLNSEKRDEAAITKYLAEALVALRRRHADQALAASPARLRMIATSFLDNLQRLARQSVESCYGFISQGEANQTVLRLAERPDQAEHLHRQVLTVFEAITEGRRGPQNHPPPRKTDYDALAQELTNRGWSQADLQLFSDPRALARASQEQVCRMVQDWFAAQIAIKDQETQTRLLVESLRPVVAG